MNKYRIVKRDGLIPKCPEPGSTVYGYRGHDYGIVRDDTIGRGVACGAFTTEPGAETFFVVPLSYVAEIKP